MRRFSERAWLRPSEMRALLPLHDLDRVGGVVACVRVTRGDDEALDAGGGFVAVHGVEDVIEALGLFGFEICRDAPDQREFARGRQAWRQGMDRLFGARGGDALGR